MSEGDFSPQIGGRSPISGLEPGLGGLRRRRLPLRVMAQDWESAIRLQPAQVEHKLHRLMVRYWLAASGVYFDNRQAVSALYRMLSKRGIRVSCDFSAWGDARILLQIEATPKRWYALRIYVAEEMAESFSLESD